MAEGEGLRQTTSKGIIALSALIIGLSFALPFKLIPPGSMGQLSPEATNLYAVTAWAGWAHFLFAYQGQSRGLLAGRSAPRILTFLALIAVALAILIGLRSVVGQGVFGAVVWAYFIDHFLKAEQFFATGKAAPETLLARWVRSYQPILTFGWLTIVLLDFGQITSYQWIVWGVSLAIGLLIISTGGWRDLIEGDRRGTFISLLFVAEAAVWGTLSGLKIPVFLAGVYTFHIAAGSFYHYLGAYFAAHARRKKGEWWLGAAGVIGINLAVGLLGYAVSHVPELRWLFPVLGAEWFTVWVGLHLVASDLYPVIRRWPQARA
ncbi:MAG: hypothetical protein JST35_01245 [Armatimonadetes bacterium]|nr:hypothetical protein [Armatimonadota bacterium]